MNYEFLDRGAYNIHLIKTKKFKTVTVEVNFRRPIKKDEITKRNLLKAVLLNSTNDLPTERELIIETENLYDLKLISANSRIGNYTNLSFKIRFLEEKFTEPGMNQESINFLLDILFNPNIKDNAFKEDVVNNCKQQLEKSIIALKDNKLKYALHKLLETTKDYAYSYSSFGYLEDLTNINGEILYDYYKSILNDDLIDIFVVGDIDINLLKDSFTKYLSTRTFKKDMGNVIVDELPIRKNLNIEKEEIDANQTQLTMLCSVNGLTDFERKYTLLIFNEILGGSSNSLLFEEVREKNSYAYYINSIHKSYDNILMIYAGTSKDKQEEVIKLIKKTLQNIGKGKFNTNILDNAKETIISSIKASLDSPTGIINTYYAKVLVGSADFEERINNINKIDINDIMAISKKIKLHTVFTLESGDNNEEA